jgi:hypothetical protein
MAAAGTPAAVAVGVEAVVVGVDVVAVGMGGTSRFE